MTIRHFVYELICLIVLSACSVSMPDGNPKTLSPTIFPDYKEVTIPSNISPLNFAIDASHEAAYALFNGDDYSFVVKEKNGQFTIPTSKWKKLLNKQIGKSIDITITAKENGIWMTYQAFSIRIAIEPIDSHIAYRLIEPGYVTWNEMGIYQRDVESYNQSTIYSNKNTSNNCVNCHSFPMQNPDKMLFHMRSTYSGTMLIDGSSIKKLNTKTDKTISPLVYPSWHPSGDLIAFSVNTTQQSFHLNHENRIEVFDERSDIVVYNTKNDEIITSDLIFSKENAENFPTFSPDGRSLYFCSAPIVEMPAKYDSAFYSLCRIDFDPINLKFGDKVDTLYNAKINGGSVSFPRVSPDGKFLMFTHSSFGNFTIWHKDADLYIIDLETKETKRLNNVNSNDVESYHSWSSNSRWFVFSSRRIDGLYTRPFIAYIDENGNTGKPFILPQKKVSHYKELMKSFNIPEFIKGKVNNTSLGHRISVKARQDKGIDVKANF